MVSLLDIADQKKTVKVRGADIAVVGLSAKDIASLLSSFPELREMLAGRVGEGLAADAMQKFAPAAIAAVIAAGTGVGGDPKSIEAAGRLAVGEQIELLAVILEMTFPSGIGPFVERLEGLGLMTTGGAKAAESGWAPDTKSPAPSKP